MQITDLPALNAVLNDERHREIAREHWQGDADLLVEIQRVLGIANEMLGTQIWDKVKRKFGGK